MADCLDRDRGIGTRILGFQGLSTIGSRIKCAVLSLQSKTTRCTLKKRIGWCGINLRMDASQSNLFMVFGEIEGGAFL